MTPSARPNDRDWRAALKAFDPAAARAPVTLHAAQLLQTRGLNAQAEAALREFLERVPDHHAGLLALASLLRRLGRADEAAAFMARAAQAEAAQRDVPVAEREQVAEFFVAAERSGPTPERAPAAYVAALFDEFADHFDAQLRDKLAYRGPELLLEALTRPSDGPLANLDILDLGCGTGLAGETFRHAARRLDGVDLSPKIIAQAEAKKVYDRLDVGDITTHLNACDDCYDLILAADVFVYLGDLAPVLTATRRVLRDDGRLAFTVEAIDEGDFLLHENRRYAHSRDYLVRTAASAGLAVRYLEESSTRMQAQRPVRSFLCVLAASTDRREQG